MIGVLGIRLVHICTSQAFCFFKFRKHSDMVYFSNAFWTEMIDRTQ